LAGTVSGEDFFFSGQFSLLMLFLLFGLFHSQLLAWLRWFVW